MREPSSRRHLAVSAGVPPLLFVEGSITVSPLPPDGASGHAGGSGGVVVDRRFRSPGSSLIVGRNLWAIYGPFLPAFDGHERAAVRQMSSIEIRSGHT